MLIKRMSVRILFTLAFAAIALLLLAGWQAWLSYGAEYARSTLASHAAPEKSALVQSISNSDATTPPDNGLDRLGQAGDSFGGFNALVGAFTLFLISIAAILQWIQLQDARTTLRHEKAESRLFRLLELTREAAEDIQGTFSKSGTDEVRYGNEALASYAARVRIRAESMQARVKRNFGALNDEDMERAKSLYKLVVAYKKHVYSSSPSTFGPYFRLLFHTFRSLEESEISRSEKEKLIKVACATLPEGAVFLLALNALTYKGRNFVQIIEKMGLLEHLHPRYRRDYLDELMLAYRASAFKFASLNVAQSPSAKVGPRKFDKDFDVYEKET